MTTDKELVIHIKLYNLFESYNGLVIDCIVGFVDLALFCTSFKCNLTKVPNASLTIISDVKSKM